MSASINKTSLQHDHAHSGICPWLLSRFKGRVESCHKDCMAHKASNCLASPVQKKFMTPGLEAVRPVYSEGNRVRGEKGFFPRAQGLLLRGGGAHQVSLSCQVSNQKDLSCSELYNASHPDYTLGRWRNIGEKQSP